MSKKAAFCESKTPYHKQYNLICLIYSHQPLSGMVLGWDGILLFLFWGRLALGPTFSTFRVFRIFNVLIHFVPPPFNFTSGPKLLGCGWWFVKPGFTRLTINLVKSK